MIDSSPLQVAAATTGPRSQRMAISGNESLVHDLSSLEVSGPNGVVFSAVSDQLITNLVTLQPGESIGEHTNEQVDVLITVSSGRGQLRVDGKAEELRSEVIAIIPRGTLRSISADSRLVYFSTHMRIG